MEVFVQKLYDKTVIDSEGAVVGQLHNLTVNFNTGELQNLLVDPDGAPTDQQRHRSKYESTDDGKYLVSSSTVKAVKDKIVIR